jgi:sorbitol-specific phosphotransferase system component IIA
MAEQNTQRPEKPFLLHQEIDFPTFCTRIQLAHDEVPVAGVGGKANDVLVGVGHCDMLLPPQVFIQ